jgi:hypothetical protein
MRKPRGSRSGQINGVNCCSGSNAIVHRTKEARPSASITQSGIFSSGTAQIDTQPWAAVCVEMMFRTWDEITSRLFNQQRAVQRCVSRSNKEVVSSWILTTHEPKVTREPKINQTTSQVSLRRIPTERQGNHVHFDRTLQVQKEALPKRLSGPIGPRPTKAQLIASKSSR